jgi:hypothetical protein
MSSTLIEIIPRRASVIRTKWHNNTHLTIANIYAPNTHLQHEEFWNLIARTWQEKRLPNPDFIIGDFNITEDSLDRAPARLEHEQALDALRDLRFQLDVQDTWRINHPTSRLFTFYSNTNTYSRLDRIYTSSAHEQNICGWDTCTSAIPTDHRMVLVRFAPNNTPFIGKGRWAWPASLMNDENLIKNISKAGITAQSKITNRQMPRSSSENPQTVWEEFKVQIQQIAKITAKEHLNKIRIRTKQLEEDLRKTTANNNIDTNKSTRRQKAWIKSEISHLENKRFKKAQLYSQAKWAEQGETISKYWSKINKSKKPRDIIYKLKIPGQDQYATRFDKMAEVARTYHDNLQRDSLSDQEAEERITEIQRSMNEIPQNQKLWNENSPLHSPLKEHHIQEALYASKTGSAAGIDGIPYEIWKNLHEQHTNDQKKDLPSFNIIKMLTLVINDIQEHGVEEESDFALGWMCPIYKKKERTEIENYRPITLLNTDYKILTKALVMQLAREVHSLIHADQSGFIPRRSIFDPIRLAKLMIEYADIVEENGVLIALDQEKAYDRVKHDYLITTLETFQLPQTFIKTIKALYKNAHTRIAINGVLSAPFQVTRGVRQGDPLSCLLFDLAIEPLACALRNSDKIRGYNIPGITDKIIVNLYTDDTTIYLNESDKYSDLETILTKWCYASGAKFNLEKTEIIPIGTKTHRDRVLQTRRPNQHEPPLNENIRIAPDGPNHKQHKANTRRR